MTPVDVQLPIGTSSDLSAISRQRARSDLPERLQARREEIEEAVCARVYAIADPSEVVDPAYARGLSAAVSSALDYGIEGLRANEKHPPAVPVILLGQARLAARNRVGIDTVMRRYLAGYTLLGDFLAEEAAKLGLSSVELKYLLHAHAAAFDRLLAAVGEEHARELRSFTPSPGRHRLLLVQRLLAGEPADTTELRYPFEDWHLGLACLGPTAKDVMREIATTVGYSLLVVSPDAETAWAWLGGTQPLDPGELSVLAESTAPTGTTIALGEAWEGLAGWRLTHHQAAAASQIALLRQDRVVRHIDVALLASVLNDDLAVKSLKGFYLAPLERGRQGGKVAQKTLRAYFVADRNVSSAAAMLGVNRATFRGRLRRIEAAIGRPLSSCTAELEIALRLQDAGA